ncbi:hypothetical protein EMIT0P395_10006 [Pseudomonas sp. IT-P395]
MVRAATRAMEKNRYKSLRMKTNNYRVQGMATRVGPMAPVAKGRCAFGSISCQLRSLSDSDATLSLSNMTDGGRRAPATFP